MKRTPATQASSTIQNFVAESRGLLSAMEDALLILEKTPSAPDALNAVFRAAHTIKGTAGIFGFDELVAFTHVMENILDDVRVGDVDVDAILIALLLSCGDHCSTLLDRIQAIQKMQSTTTEVGLCLLATSFGHGLIANCLSLLTQQKRLVLIRDFDLSLSFKLNQIIQNEGINFVSSVPTHFEFFRKAGLDF